MTVNFLKSRAICLSLVAVFVVLAVVLRVYRLETDAYPALSWDTGLFTDEGFYFHNARNVILFEQWRTDGFNNVYLMPLFHMVQVSWFRLFGVGSLQTRLLSIMLSLLTLTFFFDAVQRLFGRRVGAIATFFLALDHLNLLYNRMGLMDTPAAFALVATLWAFSRAITEEKLEQRNRFALLAGVLIGVCYGVRGLAIFALPGFWLGFLLNSRLKSETNHLVRQFIIGLILFLVIFVVCWYLPNRAEISRINAFHLREQLLPKTIHQLGLNVWQAIAGVRYLGLLPYLLLHSPLLTLLTLRGLFNPSFEVETSAGERQGVLLFRLWIGAFWILFAVSNYAPSRYYVLFYPAMMALSAHQLSAIGSRNLEISGFSRRTLVFLAFWGIVNGCWFAHWISTLKTTRKDAEAWLVASLPPNTVLIGDVAPGLALDSRFQTVNVQPGLCNDLDPLTKYETSPRAIVILDGVWKEAWWIKHYPDAITEHRRITLFNPLVSHTVGVYFLRAGEHVREVGLVNNAGR